MPLHCNNFVTSAERVVIKLKIVKQFTWNSVYLKLGCIFTIIQLNRSIHAFKTRQVSHVSSIQCNSFCGNFKKHLEYIFGVHSVLKKSFLAIWLSNGEKCSLPAPASIKGFLDSQAVIFTLNADVIWKKEPLFERF